MNINIVVVGSIKENFFKDAIVEYTKRLSRYAKLNIIELKDEKTPANASELEEEKIKEVEAERILTKLSNSYVVALAIDGKRYSSEDRADEKLSFSEMTFPHQLMRVILLEQIYRAYRIRNNEPYHK